MTLEEQAEEVFRRRHGREPSHLVRAPGRVNLLGEHVDYNDGWVLPAAIDRAVHLAIAPRADALVRIHAADLGADAEYRANTAVLAVDVAGAALPPWARYPAAVTAQLNSRGFTVAGMDAVIVSDLPRGAGLSSSAALEVAFACAWQTLGGWALADAELAELCRRAETAAVGVECGVMDQLASIAGRRGNVLLLDCRTLAVQPLPFPADVAIVVADSGVRRELAASAYNERRAECDAALATLSRFVPSAQALRDVTPEVLARHADALPAILRKRARHVVEECARVREGAKLLESGRIGELGKLLDASHRSLAELYEVSCPELDALAAAARASDGCLGARLTGAGFGGCVVALVLAASASRFSEELVAAYAAATGRKSSVWVCTPSDGARSRSVSRARPRG